MKTNLAEQASHPQAQSVGVPAALTPEGILQLGLGFWGSKTLLSAVELGVFTHLAQGALSGKTLVERLGLNGRGAHDFLDALVALGMCWSGAAAPTPIPRPPISSLTATSRPISAGSLRWPMADSIRCGVT